MKVSPVQAVLAMVLQLALVARAAPADDFGLRIPPGFRVTMIADETLANDTYAMTLDAKGRPVVTTRGSIKTLEDTDRDGKADKATLFATTRTGGMGLCFDGSDLLFCGDGWLSRYRDADADGHADGSPERIVPLAFAEHGGHAMRKGPDGWWYVIGGNDSVINGRHASLASSPIRNPEAGAVLRLPPDLNGCEIIAHGFRNPYDFDFNAAGDLFTYDSDVERDAFLPWYSPTRIYHVGYASHHGWRVTGFLRSLARRDYFLDTVDILWPIGRGSPTGLTCYRHTQFPTRYWGGIFALDWTFGKVYFVPLAPDGSSYKTQAEVFLESTGTDGFAPTDAVVAPDGALLISIGGRGTRGAIYRVEYVGPERQRATEAAGLDEVLDAPQPLDAWSRARWEPQARTLGRAPFLAAVVQEPGLEARRVRAIEIATELFGGLTPRAARAAARSASPLVRARAAWSLGRKPNGANAEVLHSLADDSDPRVCLAALDALADRHTTIEAGVLRAAAAKNLANRDKRVRQAAARVAALLPAREWDALAADAADRQARLTTMLADVWRNPATEIHETAIAGALGALRGSTDPELNLQAVRLIVLALGDWHLKDPAVELNATYSVQPRLKLGADPSPALIPGIRSAVRAIFPSGNALLDDESARLLAVLEDDDRSVPPKVARFWTDESSPTRDMHYLIVYSRLGGAVQGPLTARAAHALLDLDRKLKGQGLRIKQTWAERLTELARQLLARDPSLADAIVREPGLVAPGNVAIALTLPAKERAHAARLFLAQAAKDTDFTWSAALVELFDALTLEETRPVLRERWTDFALRDAILVRLARQPEAGDREKFRWGLESDQPRVMSAAVSALERLPRAGSVDETTALVRLLRRLILESRDAALRARVLALTEREAQQSFAVEADAGDPQALLKGYQPVFAWFAKEHPAQAGALAGGAVDLEAWRTRLKAVEWSKGDAVRGEAVFRTRGCQTCHTGERALGPDLTGAAARFSRDDLFTAILAPSLDVSPLYRTTLIETHDGQIHSGLVAFESADGVILQTGATTTVRIGTPEIAARKPASRSVMPDRLLQGTSDGELADLYRYLQTLTPARSRPRS
jgi:putative membrane-bound dehydrogenase-like protein